MAVTSSKRANMLLYADRDSINSLRVKMIIAEKSAPADIFEVDPKNLPDELLEINAQGHLPTLVDRDLVLYEPCIIAEYLDERFPHPPLLPVYPIARAKARLMRLRIEREWFSLVNIIETSKNNTEIKQAKKTLLDSIVSFAPVFSSLPYFLSDEFSLLDCCVVPLLWHLPKMGMSISAQHASIHGYMERMFNRLCFKISLNHEEQEIA